MLFCQNRKKENYEINQFGSTGLNQIKSNQLTIRDGKLNRIIFRSIVVCHWEEFVYYCSLNPKQNLYELWRTLKQGMKTDQMKTITSPSKMTSLTSLNSLWTVTSKSSRLAAPPSRHHRRRNALHSKLVVSFSIHDWESL